MNVIDHSLDLNDSVTDFQRQKMVDDYFFRRELAIDARQLVNDTIRKENEGRAAVREFKVAVGLMLASWAGSALILIELYLRMETFIQSMS